MTHFLEKSKGFFLLIFATCWVWTGYSQCETVTSINENFSNMSVYGGNETPVNGRGCWKTKEETGCTNGTNAYDWRIHYQYGRGYAVTMKHKKSWLYKTLTLQAGSYKFSFLTSVLYLRRQSPSNLKVYIATNEANLASGTLLKNENVNNSLSNPKTIEGTFTVPSNGVYYFAILGDTYPTACNNYSISRDVLVGHIKLERTSSCFPPTDVSFTDITHNSAKISWTAPTIGNPDTYEYHFSLQNTPPTSGLSVGNTNISISGLNSNSEYHVWVRSVCGSEKSEWTSVAKFKTLCAAANIPFTENFEDASYATTGFFPKTTALGCWKQQSEAGSDTWEVNTTNSYNRAPRSGSKNLTLSSNNDDWIFYPMNLEGGKSYRLQFYARQDKDIEAYITAAFGNSDNPTAMAGNEIIKQEDVKSGDYQCFTGYFSPTASGVYYIGVKGETENNMRYLSLDDISVTEITCPYPTKVNSENITSNSFSVSWESPSPSASSYEVYYSTNNSAPSDATAGQKTTSGNDLTINGLNSKTTYFVWVRSVCGSQKSEWTCRSLQIETLCASENVPFTENWDDNSVHRSTPKIENCWKQQSEEGTAQWRRTHGGTNGSFSTMYRVDISNRNNTWLFKQFHLTTGFYKVTLRVANPSQSTSGNKTQIKFGNTGDFSAMTETIVPLTDITGYTSSNPNTWQLLEGELQVTQTGDYFIGINGNTRGSFSNLYLDDFSITPIDCPKPSNLQTTDIQYNTANISWKDTHSSKWEYHISTIDATPTTFSETTQKTAMFSNLTEQTTYFVFVRAICNASSQSEWIKHSFSTPCKPVDSFCEDFNGTTIPQCFSTEDANNDSRIWGISNRSGRFASNAIVLWANYTNKDYFFTKPLHLQAGIEYTLTFKYWVGYSSNYRGNIKIFYTKKAESTEINSANQVFSKENMQGEAYPNDNNFKSEEVKFTPTETGVFMLAFLADNQADIAIDDICVKLPALAIPQVSVSSPTCEKLGNIASITNVQTGVTYTLEIDGTLQNSNINATKTFTLEMGKNYKLVASRGSETQISAVFSATQMVSPALPIVMPNAVNCGDNFASAEITNFDNTLIYSVLGVGNVTTSTISNLDFGRIYTLTVQNATCSKSVTFTTSAQKTIPAVSVVPLASTCGDNFASAEITNFDNSLIYNILGVGNVTSSTISNLDFGRTYTLTVQNVTCSKSVTFTTSAEKIIPAVSVVPLASTCGDNFASAEITNFDNTLIYSVLGVGNVTTSTISNLDFGRIYTLTVQNATCSKSVTFTTSEQKTIPAVSVVPLASVCGDNFASAEITNFDNTLIYSVLGVGNVTTSTISNLDFGRTYTLTVQNATCSKSVTFTTSAEKIIPAVSVVPLASTCGDNSASAEITNFDNSLNYSILGVGNITSSVINNLEFGRTYTLTVQNATCSKSVTFTTSAQKTIPAVSVVPLASTCGDNFASAEITNFDNSLIYNVLGVGNVTSSTISNLDFGRTYTLTVQNATCSKSVTFTTSEQKTIPAVSVVPLASVCGDNFASAEITNFDNTLIYSVLGVGNVTTSTISNLDFGRIYTLTVQNATCSKSVTFTTSAQKTIPAVSVVPLASVCGDNFASAEITNFDNTLIYSVLGVGNVTTSTISNLDFGRTYTLTVQNATCSKSVTFTTSEEIYRPSQPIASDQIFCGNAIVGQLQISSRQSGTEIRWYKEGVLQTATSVLTTGMYELSQSLNGCESERYSVNVTIIEKPEKPIVHISEITCSNPKSVVTIQNITSGIIYKLVESGAETTVSQSFTIEKGKSYQLKAYSQNCYTLSDVFSAKTNYKNIEKPIIEVAPANCTSEVTTATIKNYNAEYQYVIIPNGTATITGNVISGMEIGENYTVKAIFGSCESEASNSFTAKAKRTVSAPIVINTQTFCPQTTLANVKATGSNLKWYDSPSSVTPLPLSEILSAKVYYVSQTEGECESERVAVQINIHNCGFTPPSTEDVKCKLVFYNGISPNADGKNDTFIIENIECYPNNTLKIFNRSGVKVYEAKGYNNKNVSFSARTNITSLGKGRAVHQDAYFYVLEYTHNNRNYQFTGWLFVKL